MLRNVRESCEACTRVSTAQRPTGNATHPRVLSQFFPAEMPQDADEQLGVQLFEHETAPGRHGVVGRVKGGLVRPSRSVSSRS